MYIIFRDLFRKMANFTRTSFTIYYYFLNSFILYLLPFFRSLFLFPSSNINVSLQVLQNKNSQAREFFVREVFCINNDNVIRMNIHDNTRRLKCFLDFRRPSFLFHFFAKQLATKLMLIPVFFFFFCKTYTNRRIFALTNERLS